jgi:peptidoglycan/LPS O-acetylase OafA/YrhL
MKLLIKGGQVKGFAPCSPYIIWSAAGLAFTYALEFFPATRGWVSTSGVVQIDDTRKLLHDYHWYEMLGRWIILPVPYQLWFIRVLFIYNLAYPGIRWCVTHRIVRWIFFSLAFLLWLGSMNFVFFEGEGLLFFSLGILMQKSRFNIETPGRSLRPLGWGLVFVGLSALKTVLAFRGGPLLGGALPFVLLLSHKTVVACGLVACWFGLDPLVRWCMQRRWFVWCSAFSFIIYAMHTPLIAYVIDPVLDLFHHFMFYRLATYLVLPLSVIALCVGTGALLRRITPGFYSLLTGGRGMG